jgi:hypothetical protein
MTEHRAPLDPSGTVQLTRPELAALRGLYVRLGASDPAWAAWVDGREPRGLRRLKAPLATICAGLRELGAMWTLLAVSRAASVRTSSR